MPQWLILRLVSDDLDRGVGPSALTVSALAAMIDQAWQERHLRSVRLAYRRRREALVAAIRQRMPSRRVGGHRSLRLPLALPYGTETARVIREAGALGRRWSIWTTACCVHRQSSKPSRLWRSASAPCGGVTRTRQSPGWPKPCRGRDPREADREDGAPRRGAGPLAASRPRSPPAGGSPG